jgi:hypothetical protein
MKQQKSSSHQYLSLPRILSNLGLMTWVSHASEPAGNPIHPTVSWTKELLNLRVVC